VHVHAVIKAALLGQEKLADSQSVRSR
jgi:hypothetical protein